MMTGTHATMARLVAANKFDVVGGVSDTELSLLTPVPPGDRAYLVQSWMVRLMTNRLKCGGLAIPPPIVSRTYHVLSEGLLASMQARKVSYTEFPFPLRQLLALLILVFRLVVPVCLAAFLRSTALVVILSFFVCIGYDALNETARELEHPFGLGANHLRVIAYQKQFNSKLVRLLDQTVPELGYGPPNQIGKGRSGSCIGRRSVDPRKQRDSRETWSGGANGERSHSGSGGSQALSGEMRRHDTSGAMRLSRKKSCEAPLSCPL
jgi:hypothetical protein